MSGNPAQIQRALRALCGSCPVFDDCRDYIDSVEDGEDPAPASRWFGFWAGETPKEREDRRYPGRRRPRKAS
jgi:Transcription factor WhiB